MNGQSRVVIEEIQPSIDGGLHPIRRVTGQQLEVSAHIYGDGHDMVRAELRFRHESKKTWKSATFASKENDQWIAATSLDKQGYYYYKISGWIDYALNWQHHLKRKVDDGQQVAVELADGIPYLNFVRNKATAKEKDLIDRCKKCFLSKSNYDEAISLALSVELQQIFYKYPEHRFETTSQERKVYVDRKKALFSSWYEFFPRSSSSEPGEHGNFRDCEKLIPRIAQMGFDVLYFPPIHPIGEENRKGKNNSNHAEEGDVGSPWGIGSALGGHKSIHPELGTEEEFRRLIKTAKNHDIEIAMDLAYQCAPDHPYAKEHPKWFRWRSDGSVQYAENPPKKYQDILPIFFETEDWENLWEELLSVPLYWIDRGIRIFRVDNPHTKPFQFWNWLIAKVKEKHPDVLFLAEAFTRPRIMHQLAKGGFTQSYTYFTWRNSRGELIEYMNELTKGGGKEYFRPNFWPNTPDINPYILQSGNEAIFMIRLFLAATLSSNYGVYGPVYEYMVKEAVPGKEEYLNSEKYEIGHWDWGTKNKLTELMTLINKIRKENPALQQTNNWEYCHIENEHLFGYYKEDDTGQNKLLIIVNLDPYNAQNGWVQIPLWKIGLEEGSDFTVQDLTGNSSYLWNKEWNYIELHPAWPFHLFRIIK